MARFRRLGGEQPLVGLSGSEAQPMAEFRSPRAQLMAKFWNWEAQCISLLRGLGSRSPWQGGGLSAHCTPGKVYDTLDLLATPRLP